MRFVWALLFTVACSDDFVVVDGGPEGGVEDASPADALMTDGSLSDGSMSDGSANDGTTNDGDVTTGDGGGDAAVSDAGLTDVPLDTPAPSPCALPWAIVLAYGTTSAGDGDEAYIARFSLMGEEPTRCDDLRAMGTLPASSMDVEALDETTLVVVGPDSVVAVDVETDTVRWTHPGRSDAVDAQAFAVRGDPPWMGVAWWLESSRVGAVQGFSADDRRDWRFDGQFLGVAGHPSEPLVYAAGLTSGLHVIEPFSGSEMAVLPLRNLPKPHVASGPLRIAGVRHLSSVRTAELTGTGTVVRSIDGCVPQEVAPSPRHEDEVVVWCGADAGRVSLVHTATEVATPLLGPGAADPDLEIRGLGILQ